MTDTSFADRLKAVIERDENLTPAGLAVKAGLSNSVIRKIFAGTTRSPRLVTAEKICAALGTTYEEFMADGRTEAEREIARLARQLPEPLLRELLGAARGLDAAARHVPPESREEPR